MFPTEAEDAAVRVAIKRQLQVARASGNPPSTADRYLANALERLCGSEVDRRSARLIAWVNGRRVAVHNV